MTDANIEKVAEAIWRADHQMALAWADDVTWANIGQTHKDIYCRMAHAAINEYERL